MLSGIINVKGKSRYYITVVLAACFSLPCNVLALSPRFPDPYVKTIGKYVFVMHVKRDATGAVDYSQRWTKFFGIHCRPATKKHASHCDELKKLQFYPQSGLYRKGSKTPKWEVNRYFDPDKIELSADGVHMVEYGRFVVAFYRYGKIIAHYALSDLMDNDYVLDHASYFGSIDRREINEIAKTYTVETSENMEFTFELKKGVLVKQRNLSIPAFFALFRLKDGNTVRVHNIVACQYNRIEQGVSKHTIVLTNVGDGTIEGVPFQRIRTIRILKTGDKQKTEITYQDGKTRESFNRLHDNDFCGFDETDRYVKVDGASIVDLELTSVKYSTPLGFRTPAQRMRWDTTSWESVKKGVCRSINLNTQSTLREIRNIIIQINRFECRVNNSAFKEIFQKLTLWVRNHTDSTNLYLVTRDLIFFLNNEQMYRELWQVFDASIRNFESSRSTDRDFFYGHLAILNWASLLSQSENQSRLQRYDDAQLKVAYATIFSGNYLKDEFNHLWHKLFRDISTGIRDTTPSTLMPAHKYLGEYGLLIERECNSENAQLRSKALDTYAHIYHIENQVHPNTHPHVVAASLDWAYCSFYANTLADIDYVNLARLYSHVKTSFDKSLFLNHAYKFKKLAKYLEKINIEAAVEMRKQQISILVARQKMLSASNTLVTLSSYYRRLGNTNLEEMSLIQSIELLDRFEDPGAYLLANKRLSEFYSRQSSQ